MNASMVFVSYSWTSPEHGRRVIELATDLRESGVDAILNKGDWMEDDDANAFMEKMVSDMELTKVIVIYDGIYAENQTREKSAQKPKCRSSPKNSMSSWIRTSSRQWL